MAMRTNQHGPRSLNISQAELNNIQSTLNEYFSKVFISVMQDASKMNDIVKILMDNGHFRNYQLITIMMSPLLWLVKL